MGAAKRVVIEGIVQGVGFRPFVYRAAAHFGIRGYVTNAGGVVEIIAVGGDFSGFAREIEGNAPSGARIERIEITDCRDDTLFEKFSIADSRDGGFARFVSPDLSVCGDCLQEIFNGEDDRRGGHFFCSCVNCGARYTIIDALPYDRANTAMGGFALCELCGAEYTDPADRRFHAETTCCNGCGPALLWKGDKDLTGAAAFGAAVKILAGGGVIAIKGIGGYHLACSPFEEQAVETIRRLKHRDAKPLAVMFGGLETAGRFCVMSEAEERLMSSPPKPITLVKIKKDILAPGVLNGDSRIGAFLPYTPLHALLLAELDALVLTSANKSGANIIIDDGEAIGFWLQGNERLFRGVLYNDRKILRSAEDSVAQICRGKPQVLRRSRGFAPQPIRAGGGGTVFAAGGDLKAAFCLAKGGYIYQSQYFGDLEDAGVLAAYEQAAADLSALLDIKPAKAAHDAHPAYLSAEFAASMNIPAKIIQHHYSHAASVMAEHGLSRVLAVCFDGTGYGDDGAVWGGEFLIADKTGFRRIGHLGYVNLAGGDLAAKNAEQTACGYLGAGVMGAGGRDAQVLQAAVSFGVNTARYSSAGRLFDAVAAILGLCFRNEYEGQCAVSVQRAAERALGTGVYDALDIEITVSDGKYILGQIKLAQNIKAAYDGGASADSLALGFHHALARATAKVCASAADENAVYDIALTGGVFQNVLLTELCEKYINEESPNLKIFTNEMYPPNDNGLALGQAWVTETGDRKPEKTIKPETMQPGFSGIRYPVSRFYLGG